MACRRVISLTAVLGVVVSAMVVSTAQGAAAASLRLHGRSFPIPSPNAQPIEIALGPDGNLWFTEQNTSAVARVTPDGVISEFPTPTPGFPYDITAGPDGNVWFTEGSNGRIARITPDGTIREVVFSDFDAAGGITTGPDGNIWFTDATGDKVWRFELATRTLTDFAVPTTNSFPGHITTGTDGNLWFVEGAAGKIGRVTPDGEVTEPVTGLSNPFEITTGADGNVWFTEPFIQRFGKVTPAGDVTFYSNGHQVASIAPGPTGRLVFSSFSESRIGTISFDGVGRASPKVDESAPTGIAMGPNGSVWFLGSGSNRVYRAVAR